MVRGKHTRIASPIADLVGVKALLAEKVVVVSSQDVGASVAKKAAVAMGQGTWTSVADKVTVTPGQGVGSSLDVAVGLGSGGCGLV